MTKPPRDLAARGMFVLRTPLLARDELDRWGAGLEAPTAAAGALAAAVAADRVTLRARLRELVARPEVREAIFVSSPNLDASIDGWLADPESERGRKTERGLVRYVSRMAARPTPFGLFAGNTVGTLGDATRLEIAPRSTYKRYTRLDGDYLSRLTDKLGTEAEIRAQLRYRPNSSLCRIAGGLRYAMRREGASRTYTLINIEPTDYLFATLSRAEAGATPAALAQALCEADAEVTLDDASAYVTELIDSQVLVSELAPPVTGAEAIDDVHAQLSALAGEHATTATRLLGATRDAFGVLDRTVGNAPASYRAIGEMLAPLPVEADVARLFQVNLVPTGAVALGTAVVDELFRAIDVLRRLARPAGATELSRFRDLFVERYEAREVPLSEVLDEDAGIGFMASESPNASASPLLAGLLFPGTAGEALSRPLSPHMTHRLAAALAAGEREIVLDEADLEAIGAAKEPATTADAIAAMFVLAGASPEAIAAGDFQLSLGSVAGPSGANLLGRFCHSDPAMAAAVADHIAAEESLLPGVLFAEVVHLADGRLANISARPVLRRHEIVFLGRSGAPHEQQLAIADLLVSVRGDRVVLRSARLDREVVPRLTNAHNFSANSLGTYRFLASLQHQGILGLGFGLGSLAELPVLPRIRFGRTILQEAKWRLTKKQLEPMVEGQGAARFAAVQALRAAAKLPRWICVEDSDNVLPVDLDNALALDSLAHLVKDRSIVVVSELWPASSQLPVHGPDGRFANEIVVPLVRTTSRAALPSPPRPPAIRRTFVPGSEWFYAKLYTGPATADRVLKLIAPLVKELPEWFFIRYGDPRWHVRFRVRGAPAAFLGQLADQMRPALDDGRLWRLQLDTYEREVERYGGPAGIELAERLFCADSAAVVDIIDMFDGDGGDDRWRITLRGIDQLLGDLGLDSTMRLAVMRRVRDDYAKEHQVAGAVYFERGLGERFRTERKTLEAILDPAHDADGDLAPALARLAARSAANAPIVDELRAAEQRGALTGSIAELAPSFVHMHVNRMIRFAARAHEVVLYDLLVRLYEGRVARAKKQR